MSPSTGSSTRRATRAASSSSRPTRPGTSRRDRSSSRPTRSSTAASTTDRSSSSTPVRSVRTSECSPTTEGSPRPCCRSAPPASSPRCGTSTTPPPPSSPGRSTRRRGRRPARARPHRCPRPRPSARCGRGTPSQPPRPRHRGRRDAHRVPGVRPPPPPARPRLIDGRERRPWREGGRELRPHRSRLRGRCSPRVVDASAVGGGAATTFPAVGDPTGGLRSGRCGPQRAAGEAAGLDVRCVDGGGRVRRCLDAPAECPGAGVRRSDRRPDRRYNSSASVVRVPRAAAGGTARCGSWWSRSAGSPRD